MRPTHSSGETAVGVILAGGPGRRIGGNKASVALLGEPLLHHSLRAIRQVLHDVAIIVKPQTLLPRLEGAMVWVEPEEPAHPLLGVGEALALAGGRPILVCPLDLPFVTPRLLGALAGADSEGRPAVLATCRGRLRPLLGRYLPAAAPRLAEAVERGLALEPAVDLLEPRLLEVDGEDEPELFDVDTPDDLLLAAGLLEAQRRSVRV